MKYHERGRSFGFENRTLILVSVVNHAVESDILYSSGFTRVFIQFELKYPYEREDLLVEMYIF